MSKNIAFLFLALTLLACTKAPSSCSDSDRKCLRELLGRHPVTTISYWKSFQAKPVEDRILVAPKDLIDYVDLDNRLNGFPNKPTAATPSQALLKDIKEAVSEIPELVKKLLVDKLIGVFLVNNLGGTGYTEVVLGEDGRAMSGFIVLDANVLQKRVANQWATWKESTPFKRDANFEIEAIIEEKGGDTKKNAIQYILLHELGHVISIGKNIHPPWATSVGDIGDTTQYLFFNESWRLDRPGNKVLTKYDSTVFPDREKVVYYLGAQLSGDQMLNIYNNLEKTDFPTLYAATRPEEDWAESFVTYVHSVVMKRPFQINIKKNGKVAKSFHLCWGTPRCAKKESILSSLLGRP